MNILMDKKSVVKTTLINQNSFQLCHGMDYLIFNSRAVTVWQIDY